MIWKYGTGRDWIGGIFMLVLVTFGSMAGSAPVAAAPDEVLGNRGVAQRFFDDVLNRGDNATTDALVSSSAILRVPGGTFHGPTGCAQLVTSMHEAFPGAAFEVRDMIVDGDTVAVSWTLTDITGNGGATPTVAANAASVDGLALLRIDDYLVVEVWMR